MSEIGIRSIGTAVPKKILTNSELEKMVDTTDEWIMVRTGIKERRILGADETMAGLVVKAAQIACERSAVNPKSLDFIISATIAPDRITPAQAYEVANQLGTEKAFCFDLNAACTGFIYGLAVAESFLKTRSVKAGLVTAGEQLSKFVDYTDRASCILFGDGASATVVTNDRPDHLILRTEIGSNPSMAEDVVIGGVNDLINNRLSEYYFRQNGKTVFKFAVNIIKELYDSVPRKAGLTPEQIRYVIPHQANIRIIEAAKDIAVGKTEFICNIEHYGNTSSTSIPLAMNDYWERFQKGDYILLIGFGGGLSWGAALLEW
jgi:3-oxoacyl-[acyl-carrier-protein] synthase-3